MITAIVLSSLLGAVLGLFFRYPVLIPALAAVLTVTCVNGIVDGRRSGLSSFRCCSV